MDIITKLMMWMVGILIFNIMIPFMGIVENNIIVLIIMILLCLGGILYTCYKMEVGKVTKKLYLGYILSFLVQGILIFLAIIYLATSILDDVFMVYIYEEKYDAYQVTTTQAIQANNTKNILLELMEQSGIDTEINDTTDILIEKILNNKEKFKNYIIDNDLEEKYFSEGVDKFYDLGERRIAIYERLGMGSALLAILVVLLELYFISGKYRKIIYGMAILIYSLSILNTATDGLLAMKLVTIGKKSTTSIYEDSMLIGQTIKLFEGALIIIIAIDTYRSIVRDKRKSDIESNKGTECNGNNIVTQEHSSKQAVNKKERSVAVKKRKQKRSKKKGVNKKRKKKTKKAIKKRTNSINFIKNRRLKR